MSAALAGTGGSRRPHEVRDTRVDIMAINPTLGPGGTSPFQTSELEQLQAGLDTAKAEAKKLLDYLNSRYTDANGQPIKFENLNDWKAALNKGGVFLQGNRIGQGHTELQQQLEKIREPLRKLDAAQDLFDTVRASVDRGNETREAMERLLASGDIMGALMMVQTDRASTLDDQLKNQIRIMNDRNVQIQQLNNQLAVEQGKNPKDDAAITRINGQIQKLNGDSQLQMIQIQDLTNKRNQAYEMLSNLMQKFQKALDTIVSNMR
jgi:hypothetical protein